MKSSFAQALFIIKQQLIFDAFNCHLLNAWRTFQKALSFNPYNLMF
jgi:hypothetical protein